MNNFEKAVYEEMNGRKYNEDMLYKQGAIEFAQKLKEVANNNILAQTFGLHSKAICTLIDEVLEEVERGVKND